MKAKYYEKIAEAIKESGALLNAEDDMYLRKWCFIPLLCIILKEENPRFDENKFKELLK